MNTGEQREFRAELRSTARAFLASRCPPARVRAIGEGTDNGSALRREVAELGWFGVEAPEEHGGLGAGAPELMVLFEEAGRALAPLPLLGTAALGVAALRRAGGTLAAEWLPRVASGDVLIAAALDGDLVCDLPSADAVIVESGAELWLVPLGGENVRVEPVPTHDRTRSLARLSLPDGLPPDARRLEGASRAELFDRAALAVAADCVGGAERVLEITLEHLRTREQFGRPLGSFQALKHRCADMFLALTRARGAVEHAASAVDSPTERAAAVSIAKLTAGEAYFQIASEGVQLHGGIGFTWEHDMHLFLKRAALNAVLFGDADEHLNRMDALILP